MAAPPPALPEGHAVSGESAGEAAERRLAEPGKEDAFPSRPRAPGLRRILVNVADPEETRIGVVEGGRLEEVYFDATQPFRTRA